MQKVLITGGSSGIGLELAKIMAENGHDLVLVSRDMKQLEKAKQEIQDKFSVKVTLLSADLSQPGSAKKIYDTLRDQNIEILVNNAGVGLKGDFFTDDIDRNQSMAYLNMNSLMDLTYYFGKVFVANNSGKILNIASIVSFLPGTKQPVYYATKAFVRSFSRALAYNLRNTNVTVTALHPGVTKTNFFATANVGSFKGGDSPRSVAQLGYKAMMNGKIEVTNGLWNRILTNVFVRVVPYRLQAVIVDKASEF
jgi:short-subunit dehydrogenase